MRIFSTSAGWLLLALPALAGLGSCSVYVPMQGAAPVIRNKGELEATGSWALTNRFDAALTYSPVRHLLVRAATSTKPGPDNRTDSAYYAQVNQYELGVGTYWPLGKQWLVGGLAAFGRAHAQARYDDDGFNLFILRSATQHRFDANYTKYSLEAYGSWQASPATSLGVAYRLVQLRLTDVTDNGLPVRSAPILRSEPMFFLRVRPGGEAGVVQFQLASGGSSTFGYNERTDDDRADPTRQFKLSRSYVSVGLALYPHLLWRKKTGL